MVHSIRKEMITAQNSSNQGTMSRAERRRAERAARKQEQYAKSGFKEKKPLYLAADKDIDYLAAINGILETGAGAVVNVFSSKSLFTKEPEAIFYFFKAGDIVLQVMDNGDMSLFNKADTDLVFHSIMSDGEHILDICEVDKSIEEEWNQKYDVICDTLCENLPEIIEYNLKDTKLSA